MWFYEVPADWTAEVIVRRRDERFYGMLELRYKDKVVATLAVSGASDVAALMRRLRRRVFEMAVRNGLDPDGVGIKVVE